MKTMDTTPVTRQSTVASAVREQFGDTAAALPHLTPELSKLARRELALTQNDVIAATGIQAYKVKQFEGRGMSIDRRDREALAGFYESQRPGIIVELTEHMRQSLTHTAAVVAPDTPAALPPLQQGFTYTPRPGFIISDELAPQLIDRLMGRLDLNDDKIAALTAEAFNTSMFGNMTDETEAKARELVGTMAESYAIFRFLQGRNIVSTARDEPKTIGEFLGQMLQDSPLIPIMSDAEAAEPKPTRHPATRPQPSTADSEA